jgi:hypothetical protein
MAPWAGGIISSTIGGICSGARHLDGLNSSYLSDYLFISHISTGDGGEETMNHRKWLSRMIGLTLVVLLLAACGAGEPSAVQTVEDFHQAVNAIGPGEEIEEGQVEAGEGLNTLGDIYAEHTTSPMLPMQALTLLMASGQFRFTDMEYELVSDTPECAVVRATGGVAAGQETLAFDEDYVVVRQDGRWLIDLGAASCD